MKTRRNIVLLTLILSMAFLIGCGKTSDQDVAEKKAKELRKGTGSFHPTPRKNY